MKMSWWFLGIAILAMGLPLAACDVEEEENGDYPYNPGDAATRGDSEFTGDRVSGDIAEPGDNNPSAGDFGPGACSNPADQTEFMSIDLIDLAMTCSSQCLLSSDPVCEDLCVQDNTNLSAECSACSGELTRCGNDNCLSDCAAALVGGDTAPCVACIEANCYADFSTCAGMMPGA